MNNDLRDYKAPDALEFMEAAREVFVTLAGAAALVLIGYGIVLAVFSL